jgi:hypothetical protein
MAALLTGALSGGLAITVLQMLIGRVLPSADLPPAPPHVLPWLIVANIVLAGLLSWIARGSRLHGIRLVVMLYVVTLLIGEVSSLLEAVFFKVLTLSAVLRSTPGVLIPPFVGILILVWMTGTWPAPAMPAPAPAARWPRLVGRGVIGSVLYLVCYFAAGLLVLPFVRDYYASKGLMPAPGMVLAVELLIRGPMFVFAVATIGRAMPGTRGRHALAGALAMSVIGGVVPLIVPNAVFPDTIRWAHFIEVVTSNFVFGAIAGWLMSGPRAKVLAPVESAHAAVARPAL